MAFSKENRKTGPEMCHTYGWLAGSHEFNAGTHQDYAKLVDSGLIALIEPTRSRVSYWRRIPVHRIKESSAVKNDQYFAYFEVGRYVFTL